MDPLEAIGLAVAAFVAGAINAVAGGGSLITFPSLIAAGYTAKDANVTNTVAVWPGNVGGALGYRYKLSLQPGNIRMTIVPVLLGAILGSAILLSTPETIFEALVPFLILGACAILAMQDYLGKIASHRLLMPDGSPRKRVVQFGVFGISVYGGYFGAGMGILMLALFGLLLPDDIQRSNALKVLIAVLINGIAALYFAVFANVAWLAAGIMAAGSLAGGFGGVTIARRMPRKQLRIAIITYGVIAAIVILIRG